MGRGGQPRPGESGRPSVVSDSTGARMALLGVRALVVLTAAIMAGGFLNWRAGVLVGALAALSYLLLATLGPRLRAPYGRGRLLRTLHRSGYHVIPDGHSRHLAVGPGGVYLLETRTWQHAVSWASGDWRIGDLPAARVVDRLGAQAARLERSLGLPEDWPGAPVVPVIAVAGRLPEPVMRAGRTVIARPRSAVRHILAQPEILDAGDVADIAVRVEEGRW